MNKSLHTKLVLIMLLLIISLMTVVCAFLIRGVQSFYLNEFYEQMSSVFSDQEFSANVHDASKQDNAPEKLNDVISAYSGLLGINSGSRNYCILDGLTGAALAGPGGENLEITPNILAALDGRNGSESSISADYMDLAIPVSGENAEYIIYIRDSKESVQRLNLELFMIIMQALVFGLVISVFLSLLLSKTMVTPIQKLTRAAERVASGDFSSSNRDEVQTHDEIGVLTATFNDMAGRLHTTLNDIESERNKLSTVILHMTDGLVVFSRSGSLIHYNPAAERLLARDMSALPPSYDELFSDVADASELMSMHNQDHITIGRSIAGRELQIFLASFSGDGEQGGILGVIHDITEQKRSDDLRREFVANVSHELRTPITNIRSYTETLVETDDIPPEMQLSFLKVILSESDRMATLVQDLLTLSRFDAGNAGLRLAPFSLEATIRDVCAAITLEAAKHSHELSLHFDMPLPEIVGDKARIEQVMVNIVSNAVKYTPDGGSIQVRGLHSGDDVYISVTDNGIGIPEADQPRIFERFYRVDKARSRAYGGTGLGLSIAQEIVTSHGGEIILQSQSGVGTCVTVRLPVEAKPPVPEESGGEG